MLPAPGPGRYPRGGQAIALLASHPCSKIATVSQQNAPLFPIKQTQIILPSSRSSANNSDDIFL